MLKRSCVGSNRTCIYFWWLLLSSLLFALVQSMPPKPHEMLTLQTKNGAFSMKDVDDWKQRAIYLRRIFHEADKPSGHDWSIGKTCEEHGCDKSDCSMCAVLASKFYFPQKRIIHRNKRDEKQSSELEENKEVVQPAILNFHELLHLIQVFKSWREQLLAKKKVTMKTSHLPYCVSFVVLQHIINALNDVNMVQTWRDDQVTLAKAWQSNLQTRLQTLYNKALTLTDQFKHQYEVKLQSLFMNPSLSLTQLIQSGNQIVELSAYLAHVLVRPLNWRDGDKPWQNIYERRFNAQMHLQDALHRLQAAAKRLLMEQDYKLQQALQTIQNKNQESKKQRKMNELANVVQVIAEASHPVDFEADDAIQEEKKNEEMFEMLAEMQQSCVELLAMTLEYARVISLWTGSHQRLAVLLKVDDFTYVNLLDRHRLFGDGELCNPHEMRRRRKALRQRLQTERE